MSEPRPSTTTQAPRAERKALPRELADFLIELSIALHKHAMYPGGHPTLEPAAEGVARRLSNLLLERESLSLGVARDQLVIEGLATDPRNPVLHDLANRLHRHHLGAVTFKRGVSWEELEGALKLLARDAERGSDPLGLRPREEIPTWPHVQLFPLSFDRLELVGGPDEDEASHGKAALLWVGLARAAMAAEEGPGTGAQPGTVTSGAALARAAGSPSEAEVDAALSDVEAGDLEQAPAEPAAVAKAIEKHERGTAYDQVIVGYLLQIAEELKTAGGAGAAALKKKIGKMVTELDDSTLQRLLDMGGNRVQRRKFLLDASQGMAVEAVVELARAASGSGAPISNAMLRMLQKLGRHAEHGPSSRRAIAESELREQVAELVRDWELADPNPDGYALALQRMTRAEPTLVAAAETAYAPEPERLVQMALETGGRGPVLERAVEELVAHNRLPDLLNMVGQAPRASAAADAVRARVLDPALLRNAFAATPVDFGLVDRLIASLAGAAVEPLLDVLSDSESRQVRRGVIDRLLALGTALREVLPQRLQDERWHVLRNVLYLAAELPGAPAVDAVPFRHHSDPRVRREAVRVLLKQEPQARTRVICEALADEDHHVKRHALAAVSERGCPDPAVPLIVALAGDDEQDEELRVRAVKALGAKGGSLALEALLRMTEPKRRSIMQAVMASGGSAGSIQHAALGALAGFRHDSRARQRLELWARGRDPVAQKIAAEALKER